MPKDYSFLVVKGVRELLKKASTPATVTKILLAEMGKRRRFPSFSLKILLNLSILKADAKAKEWHLAGTQLQDQGTGEKPKIVSS